MLKLYFFGLVLKFISFTAMNEQMYETMPKLFEFDDFDACPVPQGRFANMPDYCVVNVEIEAARKNSKLLKYIRSFSANTKQHFNHTMLKRGICMQTCFEVHEALGQDFSNYKNEDSKLFDQENGGLTNIFNKICNICVNKQLIDSYGVVAKTSVEYCTMKSESLPFDSLDLLFVGSLLFFFVLTVISTLWGRRENPNSLNNFKRTKRLLKAYDLRDSWRIFVGNSDEFSGNEVKLQAVKLLTFFMFVFAQTYRHIVSMPLANPEYIEKTYHSFWFNMFDMEMVTSLFLVACGASTSFTLIPEITKSSNNWQLFRKTIASKFDKLVALNLGFVFFQATLLKRLGSGVFWKAATSKDFVTCRNGGWRMNFLAINNYSKDESFCIEPSWILSAEFHLTALGFTVLFLLHKFPGVKKLIFYSTILLPFIFVFTNVFFKSLSPFAFITPEILKTSLMTTGEDFSQIYRQTHFNCGSYLMGLLAGYFVVSSKTAANGTTKKLTAGFSFIFYCLLTFAIKTFIAMDNNEVSLLTAALGAYMKVHHGIFFSFFVFRFVFKINAKLLSCKLLAMLDKIFNITFFTSLIVTKLLISNSNSMIQLNLTKVFLFSVVILIVSYLVGFALSLIFEVPIAKLKSEEKEVSEKKEN